MIKLVVRQFYHRIIHVMLNYTETLEIRVDIFCLSLHAKHHSDQYFSNLHGVTCKTFVTPSIFSEHTRMISLTHWGRVTHICVGNIIIIGSDNGLSPGRRQAIIWNNAGILLIGTLGTNSSEILNEIHPFSLKKIVWKRRLRNGGHFVSASMS